MLNNALKPGTTSEPSIFMIGWLNHAPPPTVSVLCLVGGKPHLPFGLYMFYNVVRLSWRYVRDWHWVDFERGFKGCLLYERPNAKSNLKKGSLTFTLELKSQSSLLMGEIAFLNQLHQTQAGQKLYSYNVGAYIETVHINLITKW